MIQLNNSNQNPLNNIKLDKHDAYFVNKINNEITLFGQIPYTVPQQIIVQSIIDAADYFYMWWVQATRKKFFICDVDKSFLNTYNLITTERKVSLPLSRNISVVNKIYEPESGANFTEMVADYASSSAEDFGYNTQAHGINRNIHFQEIATKMVEINAINNIFGTTIAFNFNQEECVLYLKTLPKSNTILIDCDANIHVHSLYRNNYFKRLVVGYTKRHLKRVLGSHTFELPGGVTLNVEEICNNLEDIENVEEKIKISSTVGNIIVKRN